jgi:hypothetical protein
MPESIAEVRIEYPSGLRATPACAPDTVAVAVPADAVVPPRPGCAFPESTATSVLERAQQWMRSLGH